MRQSSRIASGINFGVLRFKVIDKHSSFCVSGVTSCRCLDAFDCSTLHSPSPAQPLTSLTLPPTHLHTYTPVASCAFGVVVAGSAPE